jgi:hypothetical protein
LTEFTVDGILNFLLKCTTGTQPNVARKSNREEQSKKRGEDVKAIVIDIIARLKTGEDFDDPTSPINIDDIKNLSTDDDRATAIKQTLGMDRGANQTTITARLIRGLILQTIETKSSREVLCQKTGINVEEIRKATSLVKIFDAAKNLLNYSLSKIFASRLWEDSKHFIAVVEGLDPEDRRWLNVDAATQQANHGVAAAFSGLAVTRGGVRTLLFWIAGSSSRGCRRSITSDDVDIQGGVEKGPDPGEVVVVKLHADCTIDPNPARLIPTLHD